MNEPRKTILGLLVLFLILLCGCAGSSSEQLAETESEIETSAPEEPSPEAEPSAASIYQALLTDVNAVPTTFFFDREGTLLGGVVGSGEKSAWEEIVHGLLEEL